LVTGKLRSALTAGALAVALGACEAGQGQGGGGDERRYEQSSPKATEQQSGDRPSEEAPSGAGQAPEQSGQPIATQEVNEDGSNLRVDIVSLKRSNRFISLSWKVTVKEAGSNGYWQLSTRLSTNRVNGYNVSAVTLVDTVNSLRYKVARSGASGNDDGSCVCSRTGGRRLEAGDAVSYFATFTAPPLDVTKITVDLVSLGTFNDVPIS
jgi:hypothetical protein